MGDAEMSLLNQLINEIQAERAAQIEWVKNNPSVINCWNSIEVAMQMTGLSRDHFEFGDYSRNWTRIK